MRLWFSTTAITMLGFALSLVAASTHAQQVHDTALEEWKAFAQKCIIEHQPYNGAQVAKAIIVLKKYLNSKNIICETYPPNPEEDQDVLAGDPPAKNLRIIITPASKIPNAQAIHPLCALAEERFWQATSSAEICYSISHITNPSFRPFDGYYVGNDFAQPGFLQQLILPADTFERVTSSSDPAKAILEHEGLQYLLAQHAIHEHGRKTGRISPFYVSLIHEKDGETVVDLELWRIPATRAALRVLATKLTEAKDEEAGKQIRDKIEFYTKRAEKERSFASDEISKLQSLVYPSQNASKQPTQQETDIEFKPAWDDLLWAKISYADRLAVFYLGLSKNLENVESSTLKARLSAKMSETLQALEKEKAYLANVAAKLNASADELVAAIHP